MPAFTRARPRPTFCPPRRPCPRGPADTGRPPRHGTTSHAVALSIPGMPFAASPCVVRTRSAGPAADASWSRQCALPSRPRADPCTTFLSTRRCITSRGIRLWKPNERGDRTACASTTQQDHSGTPRHDGIRTRLCAAYLFCSSSLVGPLDAWPAAIRACRVAGLRSCPDRYAVPAGRSRSRADRRRSPAAASGLRHR